ncbi:hypothetical protein [Cupriavidus sp. MP-37]|uniref:hypothetical protein n=1 Tax=Cupriavidus sp. MP-37 TaxID=2884455 RepID=UPI001D0B8805|nr:hypothetical protein [Cupriavidus sp. MP-37]UDM49577.1 hypothetical protein LIN44_13255 [Cupriavidus sp. MP-37]
MAAFQFRGSKNRQRPEAVAACRLLFSPSSFSFSLILKGKKEKKGAGRQNGGVAKEKQIVAKTTETVVSISL